MSPSKIDSSRPFYPFRVYVIYPLVGVAAGWVLAVSGAFGDVGTAPAGTLPVCTTTTTTTPQR